MLLRTRLTLMLSLAFVVVVGALVLASLRREELLEERMAQVAIAGQLSLWQQLVGRVSEDLRGKAVELAGNPTLALALEDRSALRTALAYVVPPLVSSGVDLVQVVDPHGELIFSNRPSIEERTMLDAASIDRIVGSGEAIEGIRQDMPDRYVVLAAVPMRAEGRVVAILTLANDAEGILRRFARDFGAPSFLVSLRGRLVRATDDDLWRALEPSVPPRTPSFFMLSTDTRLFAVTGVPLPDFSGGVAGTLVTLRDSTESLAAMRQLGYYAVLAVVGFVLIVIVGLYFYLRRSFQPLEGAISVLRALSQGDTNVRLEDAGQGEIRRIAEAVDVFRRNTVQLADHRQMQERLRRRQERLIRLQMRHLAGTLENEGKEQVLEDLQPVVQRRLERIDGGVPPGSEAGEQLGMLAAVLQRMSSRITDQHQRLTELVAELREAIVTRTKLAGLQQELEIARQLQLSILPKALPPRPDVAVHGLMVPAKEVGGDFYDFFLLDEDHLGFVVADVSGKGVPAALFMAITRTLLKATTLFSASPASCLQRLNAFLAAENDQMMFVTLIYGVLDLETGRFSYVNAGHNPPMVLKADGRVVPLTGAHGMAIAVLEEAPYLEQSMTMEPGDGLLFYTDGVTEAFDIDEQPFGEARLQAFLATLPPDTAPAQVNLRLLQAVRDFERGAAQADDITCVVLRYHGRED